MNPQTSWEIRVEVVVEELWQCSTTNSCQGAHGQYTSTITMSRFILLNFKNKSINHSVGKNPITFLTSVNF